MSINKDKYNQFCTQTYVPIYSKPWWMDAVCLPENWDVWIYEEGGVVVAAMPYYCEERNGKKYITKAPLTQNNGIIFNYPEGAKRVAKAKFEEKVIDLACEYISGLQVDVYEQQYQTSFTNWLPFMWNGYSEMTRYTYIIDDTSDLDRVWENISSTRHRVIKKGRKTSPEHDEMTQKAFYPEHEKIFLRQGLKCPFSYELFERVSSACLVNKSGRIWCRKTKVQEITAVSFIVWDERKLYKLMGGPIPEYSQLDAYSAMTWDEIEVAHEMGLKYDFEGSVIKNISKAFREYGAVPTPYFRIRKVFDPEIIQKEAFDQIEKLHYRNRE